MDSINHIIASLVERLVAAVAFRSCSSCDRIGRPLWAAHCLQSPVPSPQSPVSSLLPPVCRPASLRPVAVHLCPRTVNDAAKCVGSCENLLNHCLKVHSADTSQALCPAVGKIRCSLTSWLQSSRDSGRPSILHSQIALAVEPSPISLRAPNCLLKHDSLNKK